MTAVQAADPAEYTMSLKCASMHIIAGQVLGQDAENGERFSNMQAEEASEYIDFAQQLKPGLTEAQLDTELTAQMDKDVAVITAPDADMKGFLAQRVRECETLKTKI